MEYLEYKNRKDITVYDNFLDYRHYHVLKTAFCSESAYRAPFFYTGAIVSHDNLNHGYNFQFTHVLIGGVGDKEVQSPYWKNLFPILDKLNVQRVLRAKVNIRTRTPEIYESKMHIDVRQKIEGHKTAIYYLNTNDGYTLFETGKKVQSVGNRLVLFDGQLYHCGTSCTDQNIRSVLNLNFI
tara:strand:+ start:106 stop:651 length:546 start_codon:yes stop_codon:yes gene_type:complete